MRRGIGVRRLTRGAVVVGCRMLDAVGFAATGVLASDGPAFYNGATSGSLHGTPFIDPNVPNC